MKQRRGAHSKAEHRRWELEAVSAIDRFLSTSGLAVDPASPPLLVELTTLLRTTARPLGLISRRDEPRLVDRHVLDCLRAVAAFEPSDREVIDLGSGAGLPGLVLAIALRRCSFSLLEPRQRAAGFLELAVERLGLTNVEVVVNRAEDVTTAVDVVTARAFAPVYRAWPAARKLLRAGGRLVYFSGRGGSAEAEARRLEGVDAPQAVVALPVVESFSPLVIMSRRG